MSQAPQEAVNATNAANQTNNGPADGAAAANATQAQATGTEANQQATQQQAGTETETGGAGSKEAVLAELAGERRARQNFITALRSV